MDTRYSRPICNLSLTKMEDLKKQVTEQLEQFIGEPDTPVTRAKMNSVLIPMIRKIMPAVIAQDIVGVQPMTGGITPPRKKFILLDQTVDNLPAPPDGYVTVDVMGEVARWIEEQAIHMWKFGDVPAYSFGMERYTISEELYTMMALKWS